MINKDLYYQKGRNYGSLYNFPLKPLITDFSFYDFCESAYSPDHGAFLVITDKQYVVGYNAGFGEGSHLYAFARVMKDMHGGGDIKDEKEALKLDMDLESQYPFARIIYETYEDDSTHQTRNVGYITFIFATFGKNKTFTPLQYEQFMKFYEKYNEEIKFVCKKFNFYVNYTTRGETGSIEHHYSKNLDGVLDYIKNHIVNKKVDNNEIILNSEELKK